MDNLPRHRYFAGGLTTAERGRGGGYALDRSHSLPPVNFTAREAALLVALGRFAIEMRLLPFPEKLDSALEKCERRFSHRRSASFCCG